MQLSLWCKLFALVSEKLIIFLKFCKQSISEQQLMKYLYFFNSTALFITILRSDLIKKMHIEFEEFRTNSIELWQFNVWTSSIYTISDLYAHFLNEELIFLFNFVIYHCHFSCSWSFFSLSSSSSLSSCSMNHLERVMTVSLNYHNDALQNALKILHLKIQTALHYDEILNSYHE